jgi:hypothetical protein
MIPELEALLDGYLFVARRNGELARYVRRHVIAALDEAATLSLGREADEPAALFYAFARRDEAFPPVLWNAFAERVAVGAANALGLALKADVDRVRAGDGDGDPGAEVRGERGAGAEPRRVRGGGAAEGTGTCWTTGSV